MVNEKRAAEETIFSYLDELRESGTTNMFGARPYLMEAFGLPPNQAANILSRWMKTFAARHPGSRVGD